MTAIKPVWARHGSGCDRFFHAIHTVGASVITHCLGRWSVNEPAEITMDPPADVQCPACLDGLADVARLQEAGVTT